MARATNAAHAGDNPRLKAMFDADQAEREQDPINWDALVPNNLKRRAGLHGMLEQNTVATGLDYYEAAFIQQNRHSQIFGTQTVIRTVAGTGNEEAPTRAPFNTTLVSDSLRATLGIADPKTLAKRLSEKDYHSSDDEK